MQRFNVIASIMAGLILVLAGVLIDLGIALVRILRHRKNRKEGNNDKSGD